MSKKPLFFANPESEDRNLTNPYRNQDPLSGINSTDVILSRLENSAPTDPELAELFAAVDALDEESPAEQNRS